MAHELLQARQHTESHTNVVAQQLQVLRAKLDAALAARVK
jgi:hypothetical protein